MSGRRQLQNKQHPHKDPHNKYRCHSRHHLLIHHGQAINSQACCRWDNYPVPNLPLKPNFNNHHDTTIPILHFVFLWSKKYNVNSIYSTFTLAQLQNFIFIFSLILLETTSSDRAGSYDHNGTTFVSIPILEAESQKLPVLCLWILSRQPFRVRTRIIVRSKGLIEGILTQLRS